MTSPSCSAVLATDGGSRGNPGAAGVGFVLFSGTQPALSLDEALSYGGAYIGRTTNNVAEYTALIWGMHNALAAKITHLNVQADSELMIKQLTGVYRIKNPEMKRLAAQVKSLELQFDAVCYKHVYRENNKLADELANRGMDTQDAQGIGRILAPICSLEDKTPTAPRNEAQLKSILSDSHIDITQLSSNQPHDDQDAPKQLQGERPVEKGGDQTRVHSSSVPPFLSASARPESIDIHTIDNKSFDSQEMSSASLGSAAVDTSANAYITESIFDQSYADYQSDAEGETTMNHRTDAPTILIGVTGSISAYKSCILVRLLKKAGCCVYVVMTENATRFVTPLTFEELSGNPVTVDLFHSTISTNPHITLADEADVCVVAPATANLIAKLSQGICDDALTSTLLASTSPLVIAPAMNHKMYNHVATQTNLTTLTARGAIVVDPEEGSLACGDEGIGCLADPQIIFDAIMECLEGK